MNRQKSGQQAVPVSPLGNSYLPRVWMTTGLLFSQYSSTLYNVTMEAVTQSLLSWKKSPAWKHFFISPSSTKAICTYCMKEFSRGKNEKDLSTSCLMRHVRGHTPPSSFKKMEVYQQGPPFPLPLFCFHHSLQMWETFALCSYLSDLSRNCLPRSHPLTK